MQLVHEVTARLENKPGRLAKICSALAHEKINIQALSRHGHRRPERPPAGDRRPRRHPPHPDVAGHRVGAGRGPGRRDGEQARRAGAGPGALAEEHINVEYAYAAYAAAPRQVAGDLPHLQPEEGGPGPDRRGQRPRQRPRPRAPAACTRVERAGRLAAEPPRRRRAARLHVVLVEPEIAGNVGAIGRTCVAAGARLWLVRPLGFHLDDRHLRRAGPRLLALPRLARRRLPRRGLRRPRRRPPLVLQHQGRSRRTPRPRTARATPWSSAPRAAASPSRGSLPARLAPSASRSAPRPAA